MGFVGLSFLKLKLTISNHNLKSFSDHLPINTLNLANCDMDSTMMSCKISSYFHGIIFVSLVHYLQSQRQLKDTIYLERYMYISKYLSHMIDYANWKIILTQ